MPFTNDLTRLLGIDFPLIQAGMAGFAGSELALAVSNSGALGVLAGHGIGLEELRSELETIRRGTDRAFGVNLLLPNDLVSPAEAEDIDLSDLEKVNERLNVFREEVGLPPETGLPPAPARNVEEKLELVLEAKAPVLSIGLGNPDHALVERCHRQGTKVVAMVCTLADAKTVEASGVDAIVVQGAEGGGHRSHSQKPESASYGLVGSMVLIPEVVDSVRIPVIAAGGIVDGRSLVAALALGAQGAMMGTRFLATHESLAQPSYKRSIVAGESNGTVVTDVASGRYARVLRNRFADGYGEGPVLPFGWQGSATAPIFDRARELEDPEHMALWAGQSAGRIQEVANAAEVVRRIIAESEAVLAQLNPK